MNFIWQGLTEAWRLIISGDPYLIQVTLTTFQVVGISTGIALVIGVPIGLALGLGRFVGRPVGLVLANAGLGLPPVIVGLVLVVLGYPDAPLGALQLRFTITGILVAQTLLALPVVIALTASAVKASPEGLLDQATALGASRLQVAALTLREARIGILAAIIAAAGTAFSEVGAIVVLGGNIEGATQTLASAVLFQVNAGAFGDALALGIILLVIIALVAALLTALQYWDGRVSGRRSRRGSV